jgi:hypothetical protein
VRILELPTSPLVPGQLDHRIAVALRSESFVALLAGEQHRPDSPYRIASVSATYNANFPHFSLTRSLFRSISDYTLKMVSFAALCGIYTLLAQSPP